jgi:hypothetical protein
MMPVYETPTIFVPYHEVDTLTRRGPRAAQPPADEVTPGTIYFVTDEGLTERSDGVIWAAYSAAPGGGVPGPHHASHEPGGSDALVALDAGILTSGTLPDARLSANVARRDLVNTFVAAQTITAPGGLRVSAPAPVVQLNEAAAPADARLWYALVSGQGLRFQTANDAGAVQGTPLRVDRLGNAVVALDVYEKGRAAPMGHYTTGDCATFMAPAGVTGPIHWAFVGKTMFVAGIGTMNFGAPVSGITLTLPGGASGLLGGWTMPLMSYLATAPGWQTGFASAAAGPTMTLYPYQQVAWPAGTSYVSFSLVFPIQ